MRVIDADALIDSMRKMGADEKVDVALIIHQIHAQPTVITASADNESADMQELKVHTPSDIEKLDQQIDRILEASRFRADLPALSGVLVRLMDAKQRIRSRKRYPKYNKKGDRND